MASGERYVIEITEVGTPKVVRGIQDIGKASQRSNSAISLLKGGLATLGFAFSVREIVGMADAVTNLRNRLSLFSQSAAQTTVITKELFDIAAETRSDFETTAQVYTRTALSARNLGFSQAQILQTTKTLNQAVILSGTNFREAANGLLQLSQAIASNRLGGDELRSTLEQLPLVADIIGAELVKLGIAVRGTRGEVRALGQQGKITAEIIINALLHASETLEKQFAGTIPTVGQALTVLATRFTQFIAGVNTASGATAFLAQSIILVANNISTLARVAAALAIGPLFAAAATAISLVVGALGGIPALLTLIGGLFLTFSDQISVSADGVVQLSDALKAGFIIAREVVVGTAQVVVGLIQDITGFFGGTKSAAQSFFSFLNTALDTLASLIDFVTQKLSFGLLQGGAVEALNAAREIARIEAEKRAATAAIDKQVEEIERKRLAQAGPKVAQPPSADEQKRIDLLAKINRDLDTQFRLLGLSNRERQIGNDLLRIEEQLRSKGFTGKALADAKAEIELKLRRNQAAQEEAKIVDEIRGPTEQLIVAQNALNAAYAHGRITLEQYNQALLDAKLQSLQTSQTLEAGVSRGFIKIQQSINDTASIAENTLTTAFDDAKSSLLDFFTTGTASLDEFVNHLQRSLADLALTSLLKSTIGSALQLTPGEPAATGTPLPGAATGADFVVGGGGGTDSKLVAFRATPGERVVVQTPEQQAQRGGRPVTVNYTIVTPDSQSFERSQGQVLARTSRALVRAAARNN